MNMRIVSNRLEEIFNRKRIEMAFYRIGVYGERRDHIREGLEMIVDARI
jgi:hypothetical protein